MTPFPLACLAYLGLALPGSTLGLLWPSMRVTLHAPLAALGLLLAAGTVASVVASAAAGRMLQRLPVGPLLGVGVAMVSAALVAEAAAPALWVLVARATLFSLGFGTVDAALNAHAAHRFGARQVNWMHASYGLGATVGPLVVTVMRTHGASWRGVEGVFAVVLAALALFFAYVRRAWGGTVDAAADEPARRPPRPAGAAARTPRAAFVGALAFTAIETGIESGAGIWGFVFLTSGRGLAPAAAGVAVSAYWAMMVVGRAVLGPVAERVGATRVLGAAVAGVALGAAVMSVPGPGAVAVAGMVLLGLAAAPVFPLLTLTTAQRLSGADSAETTRLVAWQVAASTVGSAVLPSGFGLALGAVNAVALAPLLLAMALLMWGVYALLSRGRRPATA